MTQQKPAVVLVHGAFAESASWNGVIEQLQAEAVRTIAVANPLPSIPGDAAYLWDVLAGIGAPVVLVGHSYGGMVITEAAAGSHQVAALVYVCAFAPEHGESAFDLSGKFPGSTLGQALNAYPLTAGGSEFVIRPDTFHHQFAADASSAQATVMSATQRPVTQTALTAGLPTDAPAWKTIPSWFVFGGQDLNIPVALHRFMADRASPGQRSRPCPARIFGFGPDLGFSCGHGVRPGIIAGDIHLCLRDRPFRARVAGRAVPS